MIVDKSFYNNKVINTFKFLVSRDSSILLFGSYDGKLLSELSPRRGVGIENKKNLVQKTSKRYKKLKFVFSEYRNYKSKEKFDYIILNGVLGKGKDIMQILQNVRAACTPATRIIIYQHNYLWQGIINIAEKLRIKREEGIQNWLSVEDIRAYLNSSGLEVTRCFRNTIFPLRFKGIGEVLNQLFCVIPFFDFLKLDQYIIARAIPQPSKRADSLTICITVRNEAKNIEPVVKALPKVSPWQEILFVEGHSTDGTREEIIRVIKKHKNKNIRLIGQPGTGQGDAIRVGFRDAKGDVVILYEGDGTSNPVDIHYFYEAIKSGTYEFIEGSRMVYPLKPDAMPIPNQIGNSFFANWFSFFLDQHITDVLSGIKAIDKNSYMRLYRHWGFIGVKDPFGDFELLFGAVRAGLKIGEIPIRYYPRSYGLSKTIFFQHGLILLRMAIKGYFTFRNG